LPHAHCTSTHGRPHTQQSYTLGSTPGSTLGSRARATGCQDSTTLTTGRFTPASNGALRGLSGAFGTTTPSK
jgi:hypothetical protein